MVLASGLSVEAFRPLVDPGLMLREGSAVDGDLGAPDHGHGFVLKIGDRMGQRDGLHIFRPVGQQRVHDEIVVVVGHRLEFDFLRAGSEQQQQQREDLFHAQNWML